MKKIFAIILTVIILGLCSAGISAETLPADTIDVIDTEDTSSEVTTETEVINETEVTPETEITPDSETSIDSEPILNPTDDTAIPAIEHLINFFFDGEVTISQIVEYITVALTAILSFAYSKYKRRLLIKEKAMSKTDIEIEELKAKDQDMANQVGLLGNMIVCAYLSNNLVDPELKKKLAVYAEELMKNTSINKDKLTEKLIIAAQNPNYQAKVTDLKDDIVKEASQNQDLIDDIQEDIATLVDTLNQDTSSDTKARDVIDNLKIRG